MEHIVQDPRTGGVKRSMSMREFIFALKLYTPEEMNNNLFEPFHEGEMVDVPWTVAKFLFDKAKGYNELVLGELVNDQLNNNKDEGAVAEARGAHDEEGDVRRRSNMTFTSRLRSMDDRLGDMDTNIYKLSNDVEVLTYVVSGMFEQYD
nr:hypothetical protein [Tanacetum cinerariifolium]